MITPSVNCKRDDDDDELDEDDDDDNVDDEYDDVGDDDNNHWPNIHIFARSSSSFQSIGPGNREANRPLLLPPLPPLLPLEPSQSQPLCFYSRNRFTIQLRLIHSFSC